MRPAARLDRRGSRLRLAPISVNQSRRRLSSDTYMRDFRRAVDRYDIPHSYIAFELTESTFMEYNERMPDMARQPHRLGFQLAIDSVETGYASLNLSGMIGADILKVDRSLITGFEGPLRSRVVLRGVIETARGTGMTVVCEGIETKKQYE